MESQEENSVRPNDLLERSAFIEMGNDGASVTPEDNENEGEIVNRRERV